MKGFFIALFFAYCPKLLLVKALHVLYAAGMAIDNGKAQQNEITMLLTILLLVAGLVGFALFFKSIDFFDKI